LAFLIDKLITMSKWDTIRDHFKHHDVSDEYSLLEEIYKEAVKRSETVPKECFMALTEASISIKNGQQVRGSGRWISPTAFLFVGSRRQQHVVPSVQSNGHQLPDGSPPV
jgi:hypothetical protein